jgi:hypothetical protein
MRFTLSPKWTASDHGVYLVANFTDVRQAVYVVTNGVNITNETLTPASWETNKELQTGDNIIYNDTATR